MLAGVIRAFQAPPGSESAWICVGPVSSFPDLDDLCNALDERSQSCSNGDRGRPGCKVFHVPRDDASRALAVSLAHGDEAEEVGDLRDQVLVFRYKGKFHAVDHQCPHSSFPLSRGTPFDIEDFGIVLSTGITCPKHGWSFDLFSGRADRGSYRLKIWEAELRGGGDRGAGALGSSTPELDGNSEVWIRRRPRIG